VEVIGVSEELGGFGLVDGEVPPPPDEPHEDRLKTIMAQNAHIKPLIFRYRT
jgi:hypothetical protein